MSNLLAIDPSRTDYASALFNVQTKQLVWCGFRQMLTLGKGDRVVIEMPFIYPHGRSKADPNDVVTLAYWAGRLVERAAGAWALPVTEIHPRTWKSTTDPDIVCVRIIEKLSIPERKIYFACADAIKEGQRHNVADAIGLGLYELGRYP